MRDDWGTNSLDLLATQRLPDPPFASVVTKEQVEDAIRKTGGWLSFTAQELKLPLRTVEYLVCHKYPSLQDVVSEYTELYTDLAESVIIKKIKQENLEATKFWLKCRGKKRGWTEVMENTDGQHQSVHIKIEACSPSIKITGDSTKEEVKEVDYKVEQKPNLNEILDNLKSPKI